MTQKCTPKLCPPKLLTKIHIGGGGEWNFYTSLHSFKLLEKNKTKRIKKSEKKQKSKESTIKHKKAKNEKSQKGEKRNKR